ncbi:FUCL6-like protein [Mya arenaria]|uniref:FUCL6-like protein n=1 Tax=Mya arenaria TaxID=6604 RepID=A0ABY7ECD4_MYAAR|nr:uncharacterized protein LOC128233680 isoform X1 [Mya arenaria]XP_052803437.1 uncharacterized protein LOC128233680 isoform X1 [Mya arenaria]WAR06064.1 FUCL6-like protein [Mya arenaria]
MDTLLFTLNLCVLLVVADYAHGTRNVAIGKTASMSSNHREYKWLAQTAVDGNVGNNSMLSDTCFHTTKEYQPWWRVDLHQDYYITSVVVYNRLDCCANQARKIKLTIGKSLDSMSQAGHLDGGFTTTHTFTVDPPLVGRFVQLQLYGITEFFHLCEVEVMAYPSGTYNVATGKTASQSSNFSTLKYHASTAVDGYAGDNRFASDSFFSTTKEYQPWWRVDLHQDYYITSVVVYNRLDCCANRARNIKLTIGKTLDSMSQAGYLDVLFTTPHTFTIDPPLVGRFVQLQLKGITEIFHLCEVEVMAYPSGTYNVAFGKTASQSSNYNTSKYNATTAVDGNVGDNAFASDSCFCTAKEYQPWWRVDLHQNYYITSVVMHYQLDCCGNQARNIKLTIGKSLDSMSQAGYLDGGFTTHTFTIDPPLVGRFVQLQLKGITEFFHLCEVEVMA